MDSPQIKYAKTVDGLNIACQVRGDGPVDLVYIIGMAGNFEIEFESPWGVRLLERLSSFSRVILFDKRGTGLSDRVVGAPDFDMHPDRVLALVLYNSWARAHGHPTTRWVGRRRASRSGGRRSRNIGEPRRWRGGSPKRGIACERPGVDPVGGQDLPTGVARRGAGLP